MRVIAKNSESCLYRDLKACWENYPTQRCLYVRFSQLQDFENNRDEWLSEFLKRFQSEMEDEQALAYVCHDNDLFIISRTLTHRRIQDFLAHLAPKLQPASVMRLAHLFEVGVDWSRLRAICEKKIENFNALSATGGKKKVDEMMLVNRETVMGTLDENLIRTLETRRGVREVPLVMLVEDDRFSRKLVSMSIEGKYDLSAVEDGQGAVMSYLTKAPDVLFLDIGLPDMDGYAVLQKIFALDPNAYVVMLSGNGDRENVMKAIELGAKGFVGKPFSQDKLLTYIRKSPFVQAKKKENA